LICAYCVDRSDISEAQMSYEWITRLARFARLWVITTGSRLNLTCGLEGYEGIKLITLKPRLSFKWWDGFDRAVHPGYVEFFFRAHKVAKRILKQNRVDLCHHLAPQSIRFPSPLAGLDCPLIVGPIHGGMEQPGVMKELEKTEGLIYIIRRLDRMRMNYDPLLRIHYAKARQILISAPYMKDVLLPEYLQKCVVVPGTAVSESAVRPIVDKDGGTKVQILTVCRLVPSKGIELLIRAIAKCRYDDIVLKIYGKGSLETYCQKLAERLGLADKVVWKGFVPQSEVLEAYARADIFALPTLKEPTGGAILEAMAGGLPVVCVDAGGPAYAVSDDCGIKVKLGSKSQMVDDLAEAIDRLASNAQMRRQMGANARERVRNEFSWDAVVAKMLAVYREVAGESK